MSIREYFVDKVVLVTGATGLVGRVLVEKILRDLPEVRRLYVLIRPKTLRNGEVVSAEERFDQEILASSAFQRLRNLHGDAFSSLVRDKVVAVAGDLSEENLGMDAATYQALQREVQVIINSAAVVAFDAPLGMALEINTRGPIRILEFARGCSDPIVAHVSTCYVNGTRQGLVSEEPLEPAQLMVGSNGSGDGPYQVDQEVETLSQLIQSVEHRSHAPWRRRLFALAAWSHRNGRDNGQESDPALAAERLRQEWVEQRQVAAGMHWSHRRGWNDTYTFTKAMGEQIIMRHRGDIPTVIFRPSIIESAMDSPEPGWLDGLRMLDPLIVAYGRRQFSDFPGDPEAIVDIVPVDMVVNALLATIPGVHQQGGYIVHQLATSTENPLSARVFCDLVQDYFHGEPLIGRGGPSKTLPDITFPSTNRFLRRLRFRYLLPLRGLELLGWLGSATPWGRRLRRTSRSRRTGVERLFHWVRIYSPYSNGRCLYQTRRMGEVLASLSPEEQELFSFDVAGIDWRHYIQEVHIPGIKRFLLGMGPKTMAEPERAGDTVATSGLEPAGETLGQPESVPSSHTSGNAPGAHPGGARRMSVSLPDEQQVKRWLGATWLWRPARGATRWLVSLGMRFYVGLQWEGMEHLPPSGPVIVAANHSSHLDTGALLALLGKQYPDLHPVAATDYFFRNRLWSWASRVFIDAIPFDRQSYSAEDLGLAVALLRQSHALIFYPEGGRSATGEMHTFKSGIGILAMESGAPIVPVSISGSFDALAKGRSIPKRHPVRVKFGAPISMGPYLQSSGNGANPELARRIAEDVQKAIVALR